MTRSNCALHILVAEDGSRLCKASPAICVTEHLDYASMMQSPARGETLPPGGRSAFNGAGENMLRRWEKAAARLLWLRNSGTIRAHAEAHDVHGRWLTLPEKAGNNPQAKWPSGVPPPTGKYGGKRDSSPVQKGIRNQARATDRRLQRF
jgi:hypothetical protein